MVTAGALKGSEFIPTNACLADEWFIKCKNSYTEDPNQGKIRNDIKNMSSLRVQFDIQFLSDVETKSYHKIVII